MPVETLGEVWKLGWRCTARCSWLGPAKRSERLVPWCDTTVELDLTTLVWTRGERFPILRLPEVLKCPKCARRNVRVFFTVPNEPSRLAERKKAGAG